MYCKVTEKPDLISLVDFIVYIQWLKYTLWSLGTLLKCGAPCFLWGPLCYTMASDGITFDTYCFSQFSLK